MACFSLHEDLVILLVTEKDTVALTGGCNKHGIMTQENTINWLFCP